MYALKARDKYYKREKEREEEHREERRARSRDQQSYHNSSGDSAASGRGGGGGGGRGGGGVARGGGGGERGRRKEPSTFQREAKYLGTFSLQMGSGWKKNMTKPVKQQFSRINPKDTAHAVDVTILVNMDGVKVISLDGGLVMAHALHRILLSSAEAKKSLFAMVARNPQTDPKDGVYCHLFLLPSREEANELSQIVGKAFKAAYATNSFKRDSNKKTTPSILDSMPAHLPSAAPKPWTVATGNQATPPSHAPYPLEPNSRPPPSAPSSSVNPPPPPSSQTTSDSGQLEVELLSLHSRLYELENKQSQLTSSGPPHDEAAILQVVMEISSLQQQIEEKGKRLHSLQQQTSGSHGDAVTGATGGYQDNAMATTFPSDLEALSLEDADWFQAGLPREIVVELLSQQPEGAFFVRESTSSLGSYALSLVAPDGIVKHFLIEERQGQYCLSLTGSPQPLFPSIPALILHHSQEPGPLPCVLSLATTNPIFSAEDPMAPLAAGGGREFVDHHNYHLLN